MSDYDVELLISAVFNRPSLWDKSLDSYKDRNEVLKSWGEVCKVLNAEFSTLSIHEQKSYEKDVIKKWKTLRSGYRRALERTKKAKRSGAPASKIKKYILTEDTFGSENSSQECSEAEAQEPTLSSAQPSSSQESQASKKIRTTDRKPDEFEAKMLEMIEIPNRNMAFMQGLLPTLDNFTDDEVLEFQAGTLALIQNIKRARSIRPHYAPPLFMEQGHQTIGWGYSNTPPRIHLSNHCQNTSVTSPITQMSDATDPSPSFFQYE